MEGPKILENLFYSITIVSTFTCIVRSDYNFAFGLLCYYMIRNSKDLIKTAKPVSGGVHFVVVVYKYWFDSV